MSRVRVLLTMAAVAVGGAGLAGCELGPEANVGSYGISPQSDTTPTGSPGGPGGPLGVPPGDSAMESGGIDSGGPGGPSGTGIGSPGGGQ